jgi:hypothetical protein
MSQPPERRRVAFLFNHDTAHQYSHSAGVMREYLQQAPDDEVVAVVRDAEVAAIVATMTGPEAASRITWHELLLPGWQQALLAPLNRLAPVYRLARLRRHAGLFASCDVVVSTERTCLRVKHHLGAAAPRFVFIPHGAGDRHVSYHPLLCDFDLMLLSGTKVANQMVQQRVTTAGKLRVTGYPKFDTVDLSRRVDPFGNGAPTFLYNPHFDPRLSSWYDHGNALVAAFRDDPTLGNLIITPHVMLFRRKIHYSSEFRCLRVRPDLAGFPAGTRTGLLAANVFVDLDSPALFDMSYTLSADAYIGDASSQVYEFLLRPRACFFLDARGLSRTTNPADPPADAHFWLAGPVACDVPSLLPALRQWREAAERHREQQIGLFDETFSSSDVPATTRTAAALRDYVGGLPPRARQSPA